MLNKKILAAALVGVLFAGNAAAVDLTAPTPAAATFAQELVIPAGAGGLALSGTGTDVTFATGFEIPASTNYYFVISTSNAAVKINTVTLTDATTAGTALNSSVVSGAGTNKVIVAVNPSAAVPAADKITATVGLATTALTPANVTVSLYETASNAAGGVNALATATGPYLSYGPSLKWVGTANTITADVASANAPFAQFLADSTTGTTATSGVLGSGIGLTLTGATKADSTPFTAVTDLLGTGSNITVSGAFDAVNGVTGASVTLAGANVITAGQTATQATFAATATAGSLLFNVPSTANTAIAAGSYTAKLVATAATGYQAPVVASETVGTIDHNGSTLQAPLVQIPNGWISRLALTNTGSTDAPYTIAVVNEAGQTTTTGNLTGVVPANSVKIIDDLSTVYSGNNRAALTINLAAPDNTVQGVYQIVNPTSGSISNYVLARPAK